MYAGKTSALARKISELKRSGQQGLQVVKSLVDGRYDSLDKDSQGQLRDGHIVTHLGERHECKAVERLEHLRQMPGFDDIQVLFIDEAHFLPDLTSFCAEVAKSKRVYVAGLDLDYRKQRFGQILDLKDLQDSSLELVPHRLEAKCHCGKAAMFTQRTVAAREQCLIGGKEAYGAVCSEHHTVEAPSQ